MTPCNETRFNEGPDELGLNEIAVDFELACRQQIHPGQVDRLTEVANTHAFNKGRGSPFAPLKVAKLSKAFVLIDGHHRYLALSKAGITRTLVEVLSHVKTPQEAKLASGEANWETRLALSAKERREVFRAYVKAKRHRKGKSGLKSYREIAKELPGLKKSTLNDWMRQDFPSVAAAMRKKNSEPENGAGGLQDHHQKTLANKAQHHANQIQAIAPELDKDQRESLGLTLKGTLERLGVPWVKDEYGF
ncbi:hypothetical protein [Woodsholea maritima]|uniref:hypothetical protein n=1 Tax=Woodsholea maritima TaxID=240237 RepID=UPI0003A8FBCC|nr:hypothetical protein [Woodsholea maritima]